MKKLNFAILGAFLAISLARQAFADTTIPWTKEGCESVKGIWMTAKNGTNFCRSPKSMNWWSALIWCKSIGRNLADFYHLCPGVPAEQNMTRGTCPNIQLGLNEWLWSSMIAPNGTTFWVHASAGQVEPKPRDYSDGTGIATCEE